MIILKNSFPRSYLLPSFLSVPSVRPVFPQVQRIVALM